MFVGARPYFGGCAFFEPSVQNPETCRSLPKFDRSTSRVSGRRNQTSTRESLFDWGIDFPFSQPESPSGKADVVAWLGTNDPLVLEAKVFNPNRSQRKRGLQRGFHQVSIYADNYNESVGYLVIFNCSENELVIAPDSETEPEYPHRIEFGGKTFFVVVINLNPDRKPASKEGPSSRQTVFHSELTKAITNPTEFEASAGGVPPVV